jgi:phosphonate transport system substrate-binding protein
MLRRNFVLASLFSLSLSLAGFNQNVASASEDVLRMGLIPAENNEEVAAQFEGVRKDLEEQLGRSIRVFQATDYTGIIEAMGNGQVDFAWFGPVSGMLAHQLFNAVPFAVGVSKETGESTYQSLILTRTDSDIQSLSDLEGKDVAFVDPASTSGGLVPTFMIVNETGKNPEEFFGRLVFAGTHDASVMALINGSAEAAAVADFLLEGMIDRDLVSRDDFRIIAESDPIAGPPLMYREDLDEDLKTNLTQAFLTLHERLGDDIGMGNYSNYEETSLDDYQIILKMMDMGLM